MRDDPFNGWTAAATFFRHLEEEQARAARVQRGFAVIRIEARTGVRTARELLLFYRTVAGVLRRTDRVMPMGGRALAALLSDTEETQAETAALRVREALAAHGAGFRGVVGWASASPGGDSWEEVWRNAGILMLADGALPAAA